MDEKKASFAFRIILALIKLFYPNTATVGALPDEACILVGNHAQMNGPIASELYTPAPHYIWCAGQMMHKEDVAAYAFTDFWSKKPRSVRWFYRLLSHAIVPLSVCVFNNAHTIGVYHDMRITSTFKQTVQRLQDGNHVVIFPEQDVPGNGILWSFQERFVDVAKLYYKKTGKELQFVPFYVAPNLKAMYYGEPVRFAPSSPMEEERKRICSELFSRITALAISLPRHTVVPYPNLPKKQYPLNTIAKEAQHENTRG